MLVIGIETRCGIQPVNLKSILMYALPQMEREPLLPSVIGPLNSMVLFEEAKYRNFH